MTSPSDLEAAQSFVDRAKAINAKHEAARQQMIAGFGKAIELILIAACFGVLTIISIAPTEQKLKAAALINQEQVTWQK
jgi:hypothetical protein